MISNVSSKQKNQISDISPTRLNVSSLSDGPDFQYDSDGNPVLVGMWSLGTKCGNHSEPTLQVRLGALHDFLPSEVQKTIDVHQVYGPESKLSIAAIVGGVVGGAIVLLIIATILCLALARRRKRWHETDLEGLEPSSDENTNMNTFNVNEDSSGAGNALQNADSGPKPLPLPEEWGSGVSEDAAIGTFFEPASGGPSVIPPSVPTSDDVPGKPSYQAMHEQSVQHYQQEPTSIQPTGHGEQTSQLGYAQNTYYLAPMEPNMPYSQTTGHGSYAPNYTFSQGSAPPLLPRNGVDAASPYTFGTTDRSNDSPALGENKASPSQP